MFWGQTLAQLFSKTGFTAWPLLLCSIISVAIIVERAFYFFALRFDSASLIPHGLPWGYRKAESIPSKPKHESILAKKNDELRRNGLPNSEFPRDTPSLARGSLHFTDFRRRLFILLREKRLMEAIHLCEEGANPVVYLAGVYLKNVNNKRRDSILTREGSFAIEKVERRLRWLATITHIAPLLGLLGTVTGLVAAFHEIELLGGNVQAQNLAGGIWEALLSTVFGLIVAIPCMVAYHAFEGQADLIARRMQFIVSELDEFFGYKTTKDFRAADPESDDEQIKVAE